LLWFETQLNGLVIKPSSPPSRNPLSRKTHELLLRTLSLQTAALLTRRVGTTRIFRSFPPVPAPRVQLFVTCLVDLLYPEIGERTVAERFRDAFAQTDEPIVGPSGSCVDAVRDHHPRLLEGERAALAARLATRTYELPSFIVDERGERQYLRPLNLGKPFRRAPAPRRRKNPS
jgi:Fe-S oxidoreductase